MFAFLDPLFQLIGTIGDVLYYSWFFVLPPILYQIFLLVWKDYAIGSFIGGTPHDFVEIIPPRDLEKSPLVMEMILAGLEGVYAGPSAYEDLCLGMIVLPFSFEIAGIEGQVHLYARFPRRFRPVFEAHFYGQYPNVEIRDAEDYTTLVPRIVPNKEWNLWGSDLELVAPDPVPIKTWPSFEEDITGKMIDPLSGLIEVFGRTRPGEHVWLQILATPQEESWYNTGRAYADAIKGKAKKAAKKNIFQNFIIWLAGFFGPAAVAKEAEQDQPIEFRLSPMEKKVLEAIEQNVGRYVFQVKMRFIYVAHTDIFSVSDIVPGFFGALKQFADFNLNSFKPNNDSKTKAQYLFKKPRLRIKQRLILDRYRGRKTTGKKFFLSDRELATIYHMPDMSVVAPSMARVGNTQATPPINLPIQ